MIVASSATATAVPTPSSWMNEIPDVAKVPIATQNRSAAAVTTRPVRSRPSATASRFCEAPVARFLDPGEEEDRVVGRQAERGGAEQDRLRRLETPKALSPLEHEHEDPERGAERENVHHERLQRQHDGAGEEEDQRAGREREDRERPRQVGAERRLLVDEACGLPGDARARQLRPHGADELLRAVREPFLAREEVEPPEAGCDLAGRQDRRGPRRGREAGGQRLCEASRR